MCGLAFLYDQMQAPEELSLRVKKALEKMKHRGPDNGRVELAGNVALGHRRLSIIDLAGSHQPMLDPSGRYFLTYNGEIYNYIEARSRLEVRWSFATNGDTEVLLAGLVLEGEKFLDSLEGMWAFALWDSLEKRLMLGRDRMGKKPLFFQSLPGGGLACASEMPALRKLSDGAWHEDENSTADYLRYGYQMPGYTAWQEVHEILPGHVAHWRPGVELQQQSWWQLQPQKFEGSQLEAKAQLRENLVLAVERRLVADVEVGAFLSGGVDSSLITAIVRQELGRPLKTFTIGFKDKTHDERQYARIIAKAFDTEHYEEVLQNWSEEELETLLLSHFGQPFGDTSLLPTALVSRLASQHVKVALSGDGADELFSGYQRYQIRMLLRWYTRLPRSLRFNLARLVRMFPEPTAHHSRSLIKKAHLFLDIVDKQEAETPYYAPLQFSPKRLAVLAPEIANYGHSLPALPDVTEPGDLQRMLLADASIYLPQDILVKVDRASMAQSLETRAPFLDRKVVELAFSFPQYWHRRGFKGKRMLRGSFVGLLPESVWRRRKQGFSMPLHEWFRGEFGQRLRVWLEEDPGPFDVKKTIAFLDEHVSRSRDHGYSLWLIYVYLLWRRNSMAGGVSG